MKLLTDDSKDIIKEITNKIRVNLCLVEQVEDPDRHDYDDYWLAPNVLQVFFFKSVVQITQKNSTQTIFFSESSIVTTKVVSGQWWNQTQTPQPGKLNISYIRLMTFFSHILL